MMGRGPGTVERAYQLAREGKDVTEIRAILKSEGYSDVAGQLESRTLTGDLRRIAKLNRPSEPAPG